MGVQHDNDAAKSGCHPRRDDEGKLVLIKGPHMSNIAALGVPHAIATVCPGDALPAELNGVPFEPWQGPEDEEGWEAIAGNPDPDEPPMHVPHGKKPASGVVVVEPDGRAWVVSPTNQFGGYKNTFPKGKLDDDLSMRANACKEAWEESGLKVGIIGFLGDVQRSTSVTRYYLAHRTGGRPSDMGWESQSVHLVPIAQLHDFLDSKNDHAVVDLLAKFAG